ncbi:hypothetical protein AD940_00490, partial [Gluconobacter thailandicus]|uniref:phage/plasmid replication protein, II/X family n=1 Tax=Gluconobacter thailandicus TaxID=257438 RepID=UPI00077737DA
RADGIVDSSFDKTLWLPGSYTSRIAIMSDGPGYVRLSGNPVKFLQGHNLFGCSDIVSLVCETMLRICKLLQIEPLPSDVAVWQRGDYVLSRVDVTEMYELKTYEDVSAWVKSASQSANVKWRGRGHYQEGTLYFGKVAKGKRASNWQLKIYHKGAEVLVPGHKLSEDLPSVDDLISWSRNKLRIELTLRTGELKRLSMPRACDWNPEAASAVFSTYLAKLEIGEDQMIDVEVEQELKPRHRAIIALWRTGVDIRTVLKRSQFYNVRREIFSQVGIDVGSICQDGSNVVKLRRVLEARPASLPDFASETYFDPKRVRLVA